MNFEQTVDAIVSLPRKISVLIMGKHGIGKSDAVRMAGKILDIPVVDQRLSQCDVGDIKGMPFAIGGKTYFAPPEWFPLTPADAIDLQKKLNLDSIMPSPQSGLLFLDEIDRAQREVQQAAFELVLDHRLNMRYLPEDWRVISAVNADGDIYHVNEMDAAFIDRFFVIHFNPSPEEWFLFARKDGRVHASIIEFLTTNDKLLDPTKEIIESNPGQKLYSRRSYEKFSDMIIHHEKLHAAGKVSYSLFDKIPLSLTMLGHFAAGFLGATVDTKFRGFIETNYQTLNGDIILNKWDKGIAEKVKKLVTDKRTIELGSYNQLIINYVQDNKVKELSAKQSRNLLSFIETIPNECVADFWKKFEADCKDVTRKWYSGADRQAIVARIVATLSNPQTGRGVTA